MAGCYADPLLLEEAVERIDRAIELSEDGHYPRPVVQLLQQARSRLTGGTA